MAFQIKYIIKIIKKINKTRCFLQQKIAAFLPWCYFFFLKNSFIWGCQQHPSPQSDNNMLPAGSGPVQPHSPAGHFIIKCLTQSTSPVVLNWSENNSCALLSLGFSRAWLSNIVKWPRKQANIPLKSFLILQYVEYVCGLAFPPIQYPEPLESCFNK